MYYIYWAGQKVCSCFSITSYRKTQRNFLANQQYIKHTIYRYLTIITLLYFRLAELIHLITASMCSLTILFPFLAPPPPPASATLLSILWVQLVGSFWNLLSSPASIASHTSAFSVGLMPPWGVLYPLPITISILKMSGGEIVTC